MSELIQSVTKGVVDKKAATATTTTSKTGTSDLGKDSFLQLLVTQMKYQDPLNPSTDTQFVAQLATFSQLEQMQNLSQTSTNSQAFSLLGAEVAVKAEDSSGNTTMKSGTVDYVTVTNGKAQISVNGGLYSTDQIDTVIDSTYYIKQGLPSIATAVTGTYDKSDPKNITFDVNLGKNLTVATNVAVKVNGAVLDSKYVTLSGNKVTINKDALSGLEVGSYKATVGFNDSLLTTVTDKLTIKVQE